jgi:hypothetical protein
MTFMGTLLSGNAPLRGRAGLELVVPTLDYQLAAQFWGITDPELAIKVHAIVGGTPAYRREFARDDTPDGSDDFNDWVQRTVLNPASPMFREARYLLAAEAELHDMGLYHSVLAAIADGNTTRGKIATYIRRKSGDLAHPLNVLMDCGLVHRRADAFRENQTTYEIAEPLITFYHAVMRPIWSDLAHTRDSARLWERSQSRFTADVLGSHFEQLARHWIRYFAPEETAGGFPSHVGSGTLNDPAARKTREVDVVVLGPGDDNREKLLAIGEVKWHETMGIPHLDRLRHIRGLLTAQNRHGAATARLLCLSGTGFTTELTREAAQSGDVRLLTPADLYEGVLLPAAKADEWPRCTVRLLQRGRERAPGCSREGEDRAASVLGVADDDQSAGLPDFHASSARAAAVAADPPSGCWSWLRHCSANRLISARDAVAGRDSLCRSRNRSSSMATVAWSAAILPSARSST